MKKKKNIVIWAIVLIVLSVAVAISFARARGEASQCGLLVYSPVSYEQISFPLTVSGVIDNGQSKSTGCSWTMFEGQAGTVQAYAKGNDGTWTPIADSVVIHVDDWTQEKTSFSLTLMPDMVKTLGFLKSGMSLKLVFESENPSGDPEKTRTFTLPLYFKGE